MSDTEALGYSSYVWRWLRRRTGAPSSRPDGLSLPKFPEGRHVPT
jgi:hypothetical protein